MESSKTKATTALHNKEFSTGFYENRYAHGYMDEWPQHKKQSVYEVIRQLPLPEQGQALDFGLVREFYTGPQRETWPDFEPKISSRFLNMY